MPVMDVETLSRHTFEHNESLDHNTATSHYRLAYKLLRMLMRLNCTRMHLTSAFVCQRANTLEIVAWRCHERQQFTSVRAGEGSDVVYCDQQFSVIVEDRVVSL
jgi:hypothetical protein